MSDLRVELNNFLKDFAIDKYNFQFKQNYVLEDFEIITAPSDSVEKLGYELVNLADKTLRLRVYLTVSYANTLSSYTLNLDSAVDIPGPGDEIYVANGTISTKMIEVSKYNIKSFVQDSGVFHAIGTEDYDMLVTEDGSGANIVMEDA